MMGVVQRRSIAGWVLASIALALSPAFAAKPTITKCKDANGKWHYGDFAAQECAQSRVTKINQKGMTVNQIDRPKTAEEIEAEKAEERRKADELKARAEQGRLDQLLLLTYEDAQSIEMARDTRLSALDGVITTNNEFIEKLNVRRQSLEKRLQKKPDSKQIRNELDNLIAQIAEYEQSNASILEERSRITAKYNDDLQRYLKLTQ